MSQSVIPTTIVDNVYEPFPEGTYRGRLADCKLVTNDDKTWAGLEVSFIDNEPLNDSPEDARAFTDTITIRAKGTSITEVTDFKTLPKELFGLRLGGGLLAGLAEAFGAAIRTEDGVALDLEDFISNLQSGSHKDKMAVFITRHRSRKYKNQQGEDVTVTETNAQRYLPG
jgi:hypothetical protein